MQNNRGRGRSLGLLDDYNCDNERLQMAISSYLDGEADPVEKALAEWHLADCHHCNLMVAGWSRDRSRLLQVAADPELDRIARAIANQTRAWLSEELAPRPEPRQKPRKSWPTRYAFGTVLAACALFISALSFSLSSLLSMPTAQSAPVASTAGSSFTTVAASPALLNQAEFMATTPPVEPLVQPVSYNRQPQAVSKTQMQTQTKSYLANLTPGVNTYPPLLSPSTPAVGLTRQP
ncbi:MAG TPA: zf-HC2 domain-containing protein [Chloroflexia bacterium]|nr:zf-HC2 domain-containing protein [Chloroflexia bacterium]